MVVHCDHFREVYVTIADTTEHTCDANNSVSLVTLVTNMYFHQDKPVDECLDNDDDDVSHDEINEVLAAIDQVIRTASTA